MGEAVKTPCPALSPYVDEALEALRADGIEPTLAEVVWLSRLRERCDALPRSPLRVRGEVLTVDGVRFYACHNLATCWWLAMMRQCGECMIIAPAVVFIFAHHRSAPHDVSLRELVDVDQALDTMQAWINDKPWTEFDVSDIADRLREMDGNLPRVTAPDAKDRPEVGNHAATFIGLMMSKFPGTDVEYWESGISERDALDLIEANRDDWATSATRGGHIANFRNAVKWIRIAHGR